MYNDDYEVRMFNDRTNRGRFSHEVTSAMNPTGGIGTCVLGALTAEEAMVRGGLDWTVSKRPLTTENRWGELMPVPDKYVIVRDDNDHVLDVVGKQMTPLQNTECLEFMDHHAGPNKLLTYHTVGELRGGSRIFLVATLDNLVFEPTPGDPVYPYLVLFDGKDGNMRLLSFPMYKRPGCENEVAGMVLQAEAAGNLMSFKHTSQIRKRIDEAKRVVATTTQQVAAYSERMQYLARKRINSAQWEDLLDSVMPLPEMKDEDKPGRSWTMTNNKRELVTELFHSGRGTDIVGVRGTAWGAYNAFTEYTTHHARVNVGLDKNDRDYDRVRSERLLESTWIGSNKKLAHKVEKLLLEA